MNRGKWFYCHQAKRKNVKKNENNIQENPNKLAIKLNKDIEKKPKRHVNGKWYHKYRVGGNFQHKTSRFTGMPQTNILPSLRVKKQSMSLKMMPRLYIWEINWRNFKTNIWSIWIHWQISNSRTILACGLWNSLWHCRLAIYSRSIRFFRFN